MLINVSFHNVDHSDALEFYIKDKSQKLSKLLKDSGSLRWVIEKENNQFIPKLNILSKNQQVFVRGAAENPFQAISKAIEVAKRKLKDGHN